MDLFICENSGTICATLLKLPDGGGKIFPNMTMDKMIFPWIQAHLLYWSVMLVVMAVDDAAILAMMFC